MTATMHKLTVALSGRHLISTKIPFRIHTTLHFTYYIKFYLSQHTKRSTHTDSVSKNNLLILQPYNLPFYSSS
jgi:hypothetical protein